jgi:hypothetical protein
LDVVSGVVLDAAPHLLVLGTADGEARVTMAADTAVWYGGRGNAALLRPGQRVIVRPRVGRTVRDGTAARGGCVADRVWADIGRVTGTILACGKDVVDVDMGPHRGRTRVEIPPHALGRVLVRHPRLEPGYLIDVICVRTPNGPRAVHPGTSQPGYRADALASPQLGAPVPSMLRGTATWFGGLDDRTLPSAAPQTTTAGRHRAATGHSDQTTTNGGNWTAAAGGDRATADHGDRTTTNGRDQTPPSGTNWTAPASRGTQTTTSGGNRRVAAESNRAAADRSDQTTTNGRDRTTASGDNWTAAAEGDRAAAGHQDRTGASAWAWAAAGGRGRTAGAGGNGATAIGGDGAAYPAVDPEGDAGGCVDAPSGCVAFPYLSLGSEIVVHNECDGRGARVPIVECGCVAARYCDRCVECGASPRGRIVELTPTVFVSLGGDLESGCFNTAVQALPLGLHGSYEGRAVPPDGTAAW